MEQTQLILATLERIEKSLDILNDRLTDLDKKLVNYEIPKEFLLDGRRVQELLGVNEAGVEDLVGSGKLRKIYLSEKRVRYPFKDILNLIS